MIRINLIAGERQRTVSVSTGDSGQKLMLACSLVLLVTLLGIGWWYWSLRQQAAALDAETQAAQVEVERLRSILTEVQRFETRRTDLRNRVALIEELRAAQNAPVHMLDELSRSVPERLWLTQVSQTGADLEIDGETTSLTSLSDFVGNLETSGYFVRPVEILDSLVQETEAGDVVEFTVKAQFAMPSME